MLQRVLDSEQSGPVLVRRINNVSMMLDISIYLCYFSYHNDNYKMIRSMYDNRVLIQRVCIYIIIKYKQNRTNKLSSVFFITTYNFFKACESLFVLFVFIIIYKLFVRR